MGIGAAFKAFFRALTDAEFAATVSAKALPAPAPDPLACDGLELLAVLQRDARLVDFLQEPIDGYQDAQIGAAVRAVHAGASKVLASYLTIEPVMAGEEGSSVEVPVGFDPSAIQLTGSVSGEAPYKGSLAHHGWRVSKVELPARPEGQDRAVLAPAEVEVS